MQQDSAWEGLLDDLTAFRARISNSKSINVSTTVVRAAAKGLVQSYFRNVRGELLALGVNDLDDADRHFQKLLSLANGVNRRSTYRSGLRDIRSSVQKLEALRELALGAAASHTVSNRTALSDTENEIAQTLANLVPSAALSYRQALADIRTPNRISFRGPAAELREALREVLDHLAPDDAVTSADGFKLEKDQSGPTMRQKVRFILKSRGKTKAATGPAEDATELVDERTAALVRSVYQRASLSTHVSSGVEDISSVKGYVDQILIDLLEIA